MNLQSSFCRNNYHSPPQGLRPLRFDGPHLTPQGDTPRSQSSNIRRIPFSKGDPNVHLGLEIPEFFNRDTQNPLQGVFEGLNMYDGRNSMKRSRSFFDYEQNYLNERRRNLGMEPRSRRVESQRMARNGGDSRAKRTGDIRLGGRPADFKSREFEPKLRQGCRKSVHGFKRVKHGMQRNERVEDLSVTERKRGEGARSGFASPVGVSSTWDGRLDFGSDFKIELKIEARSKYMLMIVRDRIEKACRQIMENDRAERKEIPLKPKPMTYQNENEDQNQNQRKSKSKSKNETKNKSDFLGENPVKARGDMRSNMMLFQKKVHNNNLNFSIINPVYHIQNPAVFIGSQKTDRQSEQLQLFNIFNNCSALNSRREDPSGFEKVVREAVQEKIKLTHHVGAVLLGLELNLGLEVFSAGDSILNVEKMKIVCFFFNKLIKKETVLICLQHVSEFKKYFFCESRSEIKKFK